MLDVTLFCACAALVLNAPGSHLFDAAGHYPI